MNYPSPHKLTEHITNNFGSRKFIYVPENKDITIEPKLSIGVATWLAIAQVGALLVGGLAVYFELKRKGLLPDTSAKKSRKNK